ncbi:hypothetical protein KC327_g2 [Hortaea werneckii]|nr:hypothetical protein KC327_g2 [Hortaea werneckii]
MPANYLTLSWLTTGTMESTFLWLFCAVSVRGKATNTSSLFWSQRSPTSFLRRLPGSYQKCCQSGVLLTEVHEIRSIPVVGRAWGKRLPRQINSHREPDFCPIILGICTFGSFLCVAAVEIDNWVIWKRALSKRAKNMLGSEINIITHEEDRRCMFARPRRWKADVTPSSTHDESHVRGGSVMIPRLHPWHITCPYRVSTTSLITRLMRCHSSSSHNRSSRPRRPLTRLAAIDPVVKMAIATAQLVDWVAGALGWTVSD